MTCRRSNQAGARRRKTEGAPAHEPGDVVLVAVAVEGIRLTRKSAGSVFAVDGIG